MRRKLLTTRRYPFREWNAVNRGQLGNFYEFDGLVAALKRIEPEVAQAFAESRQRIRTTTARSVKPRMSPAAGALRHTGTAGIVVNEPVVPVEHYHPPLRIRGQA